MLTRKGAIELVNKYHLSNLPVCNKLVEVYGKINSAAQVGCEGIEVVVTDRIKFAAIDDLEFRGFIIEDITEENQDKDGSWHLFIGW